MKLFKSKEEKAFIKIQKKAKLIDKMQSQIDKEKEAIDTMGKLVLEGGKLKRKDDGIPVQSQQPQMPQSPMRQPVVQTMNDTVDIVIPRQQPMQAEIQPSQEQIMAYHQQQAMQQQALRQAALEQQALQERAMQEQMMRQQLMQQQAQQQAQPNVTVKLFEVEPWQLSVPPTQMQDFLTQVANAINTKSTIQLGKHLVNGAAIEFVEYD